MKVTDVPAQTGFAEAAITTLTGNAGFTVTAKFGEGVPEPQVLDGVTEIFPEEAAAETLTVIALVFEPVTMLKPEGSDQVYEVALVTGGTE